MFLRRIALVFIVTHFQSLNKFVTSVTGHNHLINQTTFCRTIRIGEFIFVFLDNLSFLFRSRLAVKNIHCSFCTHDGYFRLWVSQVHIGSRRLAGHDNVGTSISFTGN